MHNSFIQRFLLVVFAGFCAACLLAFYKHVIQTSFHESGSGWREMYATPAPKSR